jgi:hypothetical protein
VRATVVLKEQEALAVGSIPAVTVSPDGRYIAYRSRTPAQLYLRGIDAAQAQPIPETEGAVYPFFSPNSASLGFLVGSTIKRVALGGGAPVPMAEVVLPGTLRGASWGDDGWVYYTPSVSAGLWRVPASGGRAEQLTTPDFAHGEKTHRFPFVLPGSRAVLFVVGAPNLKSYDDARIEVLSLASGKRQLLITGGSYPQYLSSGHLLYTRAGKLLARSFDAEHLQLTDDLPTTVADGMFVDAPFGSGNHSVSQNGIFVRVVGGTSVIPQTLLAVGGRRPEAEQTLRAEPGLFQGGLLSHDGARVAITSQRATSQISILDLRSGTSTPLTEEWDNASAAWSPDDSRIAFASNRGGGPSNLYWQNADGAGATIRLTTSDHQQQALSWSKNGRIAFVDIDPNSRSDIWTISIGDDRPQALVRTSADEKAPRFSPDGHWLAFQSDRTSRAEVYVQAFPGGTALPVSNTGGTQPMWRGDHEIIYRRERSVMSVSLETSPELRAAEPHELFATDYLLQDVLPDGRLLMLTNAVAPPVTELEIVVNWFQELRSKMAGR